MLERQIEAHLVKKVKELGGIAYKFVSPANRGVADRVVVLPGGGVVFVELKTATGKLSPLQEQFAREMTRLGQNYIVLKSREEVDAFAKAVSRVSG
jgi:RecB family exonuclease